MQSEGVCPAPLYWSAVLAFLTRLQAGGVYLLRDAYWALKDGVCASRRQMVIGADVGGDHVVRCRVLGMIKKPLGLRVHGSMVVDH